MSFFCYAIEISSESDSKVYIGQTSNLHKRINTHMNVLSKGEHYNKALQNFYDSEELKEISIMNIEVESREEALATEIEMIEMLKDDDTLTNIALGADFIAFHPDRSEITQKRTEYLENFRKNLSKEELEKVYGSPGEKNGMYGKTHTEEARRKISEKVRLYNKINGPPNLGYKHSEETKRKQSLIASAKVGDKNPFFGKSHTEETKNKIRNANLGRLPPNTKSVQINGTDYESITEAGRQLNLSPSVVLWRINSKSPQFSDWK